jgi:hypothetical protein
MFMGMAQLSGSSPIINMTNLTPMNDLIDSLPTSLTDEERATTVRNALSKTFGSDNVWNTEELREGYKVESFLAPTVTVIRKSDNQKGTLEFTHAPRFYFNFIKWD